MNSEAPGPSAPLFCCPTCGRTMPEPPPIEALREIIVTSHQGSILKALQHAYPNGLSAAALVDAMYGNLIGPSDPMGVLRVTVTMLRRKLEPYGWTIPRAGSGRSLASRYHLEKISREKEEASLK